jgi:hypothetical protein
MHRLRALCLTIAVAVFTAAISGCGGATFANGIYSDSEATYRVGPIGSGWKRADVDDNDLAFYRDGVGTISVNATCDEYEDVPHAALVNHLLFGTTHRQFRTEEMVPLDDRGAYHALVSAELDGVVMLVDVYVIKKDGCVYDLSLIASESTHPSAVTAFQAFVAGFSTQVPSD